MSSSPNADWWLYEAGEYVLGTLRGPERDLFEKLLERDADARSMVHFWETHLAQLDSILAQDDARAATLAIPPHVWEEIRSRLDTTRWAQGEGSSPGAGARSDFPGGAEFSGYGAAETRNRGHLWRMAAGISMAASFALGALLLNQLRLAPATRSVDTEAVEQPVAESAGVAEDLDIVAVLSDEDGTQLWLVVADETDGSLRAIALQSPPQSDTQSHQLWVVLPDNGGVESVGLLPYGDGSTRTFELSSESALERLRAGAAFAISLEPQGGTDSAAPTGPVISSSGFTRVDDSL
jgi:anti-sigma-K factor RskA